MKRVWIPIAIVTGLALIGAVGYTAYTVASNLQYEVLSYQVQYLDATGVTFRVMFALTNPMRYDVELWNQNYDVFLAGYKISRVTSTQRYRLIADNTSVIPLDVRLNWVDIEQKITPIASQSNVTTLANLPIVVKGKLSAKLGFLQLKKVPVRASMPLGTFLP